MGQHLADTFFNLRAQVRIACQNIQSVNPRDQKEMLPMT